MSSYQTGRFSEYSPEFVNVTETLVDFLRQQQTSKGARRYEGSYSIISPNTGETAAKILIYQRGIGRENLAPLALRNEGVYILIRHNGSVGPVISASGLQMLFRLHPMDEIAVAPHHDEQFRFFPVMAGENLQQLAGFLAQISYL